MNGFVLGDDVRGNAATLIDLVAVGLRPLADSRTLLAARTRARPTAAARRVSGTDFARVFHIVGKFIAKLAGPSRPNVTVSVASLPSRSSTRSTCTFWAMGNHPFCGATYLVAKDIPTILRCTNGRRDSKSTSWWPTSVLARHERCTRGEQEGCKPHATTLRDRPLGALLTFRPSRAEVRKLPMSAFGGDEITDAEGRIIPL